MELTPLALFRLLDSDLCSAGYTGENLLFPLLPWDGVRLAAAKHLRRGICKKLVSQRTSVQREKAIEKFLSCNVACSNYVMKLGNSLDELLIGQLRDELYRFFCPDEKESIFDVPVKDLEYDLGPGVNYGSSGTDLYGKLFDGPLSATSDTLVTTYHKLCAKDDRWFAAEYHRMRKFGAPSISGMSKLSTVAKNEEIDRVVMSECSINMLFQMALGRKIQQRLVTRYGLDLTKQPVKNRKLCMWGSITGQFSTIDLSSASDSIATSMLVQVIPASALRPLLYARSPATLLNKESVKLYMIGTMGNGFTFPLQTALFGAVVCAVYKTFGVPIIYPRGENDGNFAVFGDDIICLAPMYKYVVRLLEILGFTVNADKSFMEGPFRESCGVDAFKGVDIRPVFLKDLTTMQDRYVAINRLVEWQVRHRIMLPTLTSSLLKTVKKLFVPPWEQADAGIRVSFSGVQARLDENSSVLYEKFVPRAKRKRFVLGADFNTLDLRKKLVNPLGLWLSSLRGELQSEGMKQNARTASYCVTLRSNGGARYVKRLGVAPNWDYIPYGLDPLTDRKSVV